VTDSGPKNETAIAAKAGRGGVAVLGAKVWFILAGFLQQPLLKWAIGLAAYGALSGRVLGAANIVNNVVVAASTQSASRAVAQSKGHEAEALRLALRVHVPVAIVLAIAFACAAPLVAWFQHAPHVTVPLAVASAIVLAYGLYAPLVGYLNGRGQFVRQASLDVLFATLRTVGLVGVGVLFVRMGMSGPLGAIIGFAGAAALILLVALRWTGIGKPGAPATIPTVKTYLAALLPLALTQFFTNALMQQDTILLGRFLAEGAVASGLTGQVASDRADEWVGVYRACQLFAFLPYQLLLALTQILFPMLAQAKADGDGAAVERYVRSGARLGAIATGLFVAVIVAMPGTAIRVAYGADVATRGASTLRMLVLAQGLFALLGLANTVLASLGRERIAATITGTAAAFAVALGFALVPGGSFGEPMLQRMAIAVAIALASALFVATIFVRRTAKAFVPVATALRVVVAVAPCVVLGVVVPTVRPVLSPLPAVVATVTYLAMLVITRELRADDLAPIRERLRRRSAS
jgi:stage V sporulation protein B